MNNNDINRIAVALEKLVMLQGIIIQDTLERRGVPDDDLYRIFDNTRKSIKKHNQMIEDNEVK